METNATTRLVAALMAGTLPDAAPWDVGDAVVWMADAIARRDAAIDVTHIRAAARVLNERLLFEHTRRIGQAWRECAGFDPTVAKRLAQALIELSALDSAEAVLRDALERVAAPDAGVQAGSERLEYEGLLGRIEKQRFVATHDLDALVRATDRYLAQYERPSRPYWHGINAVALLAREAREGLDLGRTVTATALAAEIYDHVTERYASEPLDVWLPATASEASLALGHCDQAEFWLYRLLHHPRVQPFHVNSFHRQLREIWQASAVGGGQSCADRLAAIVMRHLMRTEARWAVSASDLQRATSDVEGDAACLEKNFTGEFGFSLESIRRMLAACASIGCVTNVAGERLGTGFLVDGGSLNDALAGTTVFVTNAHVISDTVANAIRPEAARVTFEVESACSGTPTFYPVAEVVFTSPPGDIGRPGTHLDVTIVRLEGLPAAHACLPVATGLPLIDAKARAYVVGHPRGSGLQVSLHDSLLLDVDDEERLVHYRTPTDPGSSGSPVFNKQWDVIALHHSGSSKAPRLHGDGFYEANEGIALAAIRRRFNNT